MANKTLMELSDDALFDIHAFFYPDRLRTPKVVKRTDITISVHSLSPYQTASEPFKVLINHSGTVILSGGGYFRSYNPFEFVKLVESLGYSV